MSKIKRINYGDIHDMLTNQLAEIADNKNTGEQLEEDIKKAHAMTGLASTLINLGKLQLQGAKHFGKDESVEQLYIDQE